jgi:hypothetical protein
MHTTRRLPEHQVRALSVAAEVDPRTIKRYLAGAATQGLQRDRVERALQAAGLERLLREQPQPPVPDGR